MNTPKKKALNKAPGMPFTCSWFIFLAFYVALFVAIGFFAHPSADDYNIANAVQKEGLLAALSFVLQIS